MIARIAPGDHVTWEDDDYIVEAIAGTTVRIRPVAGGPAQSAFASGLMCHATSTETWNEDEDGEVLSVAEVRRIRDSAVLDLLDEQDADDARNFERHLLEVLNNPDGDERTVDERLMEKAAILGCSRATIYRNYGRWRDEGIIGLVDRRKLHYCNPVGRTDARIVDAVRAQLGLEDNDSTGHMDRFERRVRIRLAEAHGDDAPELPSRSTMRRLIGGLTLESLSTPKDTRRNALSRPDKVYGHMTATRAGEVVMFDTKHLEVRAYDPILGKTTAVEVTVAMDVATRSVLAWRLTAAGTTATDCSLMLADMLTPEQMRPGWDDAVRFTALRMHVDRIADIDDRVSAAAARPLIMPEEIVVDHGKVFIGEVFTAACARLGISIQPARSARPTDKAIIERSFRTLRHTFSEHLAGFTGRSVAHRGKNPDDAARWTVEEIGEFFAEYVVCVWQRRVHKGCVLDGQPELKLSPNDMYAEAVARAGWIGTFDEPQLYFELLPVEWRTIQHYGVEIGGLVYDSDDPSVDALAGCRNSKSPYPGAGRKWPFRVDPRNNLHVYFLHPDGEWVALRWTHAPDYLQPFADITAAYVRRRLREERLDPTDQDELAMGLIDLQTRMDEAEAATSKDLRALLRGRARTRAALKDQARTRVLFDDYTDPSAKGAKDAGDGPDEDDGVHEAFDEFEDDDFRLDPDDIEALPGI